MSDNTTLNPGSQGDTIRTLQRSSGSVKTEVVQLDVGGPDNQAEVLVSQTNPLPTAESGLVIELLQRILTTLEAMRLQDASVYGYSYEEYN